MARQKANQSQINSNYFYAEIGTEVATGNKSFPNSVMNGFTLINTNTRIRCDVPGTYFISARQLMSTNANQIYFKIMKNTSIEIGFAYPKPNVGTQDVLTSGTCVLAANDYIEIYISNTITAAWAGGHSNITITRIA